MKYLILITLLFTSCVNDVTIDEYLQGCIDASELIYGQCLNAKTDDEKLICRIEIEQECVNMRERDYE